MSVKEVERIKKLIQDAEIENAKSKGIIESIESEWEENFGTSDVKKIKQKLSEMKESLESSNNRLESIFDELQNSQDWDKIEEDLE